MLGLDFVLFRLENRFVCFPDICCHRGGTLSDGKLSGDCLACPYHGWQFNASGQCVHIPALGADARPPKRARVDSYPTAEKYGWVWVFLGDLPESERPPIPDLLPEFDGP